MLQEISTNCDSNLENLSSETSLGLSFYSFPMARVWRLLYYVAWVPVLEGGGCVPEPGARPAIPCTRTGTPRCTWEVPGTLLKYPKHEQVRKGTGTPKCLKYPDFGDAEGTSGLEPQTCGSILVFLNLKEG